MYVTGSWVPPLRASGLMPRLRAAAYEASPMMSLGPVSPNTAYWILPL